MARKRRIDRNHAIYQITCKPTGETYIGITVMVKGSTNKSLNSRWQRHLYHALVENRTYPLQNAIRTYGSENFTISLIRVVRGKKAAHELERQLIVEKKPELNVECKRNINLATDATSILCELGFNG